MPESATTRTTSFQEHSLPAPAHMLIDAGLAELRGTKAAVVCARVTEVPLARGALVGGLRVAALEAAPQAISEFERWPWAIAAEAPDLVTREATDEDCPDPPTGGCHGPPG